MLFATHYHELVVMDQRYKQVKNVHMEINDKADAIQFLYLLRAGAAGKSYGIQVAELAGLPPEIIKQATALLKGYEVTGGLEQPKVAAPMKTPVPKVKTQNDTNQTNFKLFD